jgi:hypothetical protein
MCFAARSGVLKHGGWRIRAVFRMSATHRRGAYIPAKDAGTYAPPADRGLFIKYYQKCRNSRGPNAVRPYVFGCSSSA